MRWLCRLTGYRYGYAVCGGYRRQGGRCSAQLHAQYTRASHCVLRIAWEVNGADYELFRLWI
ncbi:hypothetical protein TPCCA_0867 [Treponema paraluiscuniculi Cuniculi A]|uniref:Uncharacterized protein n=2 Tax=Treponema paraluiscuniculi TaxID=53435 RepID=F7XQW4_TREPU|nr:hypothetical protein TPCCA_0867 [Treponema paraluiscuniculi Cuniculi A]WKC72723.1 hypothetical protein TPLL2_0867 [Treponema paraluiscuniculi]